MIRSIIIVAMLSALAVGCSSHSSPTSLSPSRLSVATGLMEADYPTQRLFRVRFDGPTGRGSFKMILRLAGPERYQLTAADALGRSLWAADYEATRFHFIDFRRALECHSGKAFPLSDVPLRSLPITALPAVLLGRLPGQLVATGSRGETKSYVDSEGRRWTVEEAAEGGVASWTLWLGGKPVLWFRQLEQESVLSHPEGSQFRWRQVVVEASETALETITPPPGVQNVDCELLSYLR